MYDPEVLKIHANMKTQYLPKMFTYRQNSRVLYEIGIGEHDGEYIVLSLYLENLLGLLWSV